ncbi:hypothetical protein MHH67_11495 [Bacillus sp. FSL K6-0047]
MTIITLTLPRITREWVEPNQAVAMYKEWAATNSEEGTLAQW